MTAEIQKPWCVYRYFSDFMGIGKITSELTGSVNILTSEGGSCADSETWDKRYVKRFPTLNDAVDYFCEHKLQHRVGESVLTDEDIRTMAKQRFSSEFTK